MKVPLIADVIAGIARLRFSQCRYLRNHKTPIGGVLQMDILFVNAFFERFARRPVLSEPAGLPQPVALWVKHITLAARHCEVR